MQNLLDEKTVDVWKRVANEEELTVAISRVNLACSKLSKFSDVGLDTRKALCDFAVKHLDDEKASPRLVCSMIELLRYLCRDPSDLDHLISPDLALAIFARANLMRIAPMPEIAVALEADKALVNILYHSKGRRELFEQNSIESLLSRLSRLRPKNRANCEFAQCSPDEINELHYLDSRLAFVVSGNSPQIQMKWNCNEAITTFLGILDDCRSSSRSQLQEKIASEMLKILFNVFCHAETFNEPLIDSVTSQCAAIVMDEEVAATLKQDAVNVLATMPSMTLSKLCPPVTADSPSSLVYDGKDMTFPNCVLQLLNKKLETLESGDTDLMGTFFTVLIHLSTTCKEARRFLRLQVMPPLRAEHVMQRPDEGETMRNRVIRLMAGVSNCRHLAAEFLFVLCKRSVHRLIKYTGFGHAAGLLANYGFLGQLGTPRRDSDSEDSETEDYKEIETQVNPVTGYVQPPSSNPLEGMSEEQKEYEAVKLAEAMNKLLDCGVIRPGTIGDDGKPRAVEHVLELVKDKTGVDNDSDRDSVD